VRHLQSVSIESDVLQSDVDEGGDEAIRCVSEVMRCVCEVTGDRQGVKTRGTSGAAC